MTIINDKFQCSAYGYASECHSQVTNVTINAFSSGILAASTRFVYNLVVLNIDRIYFCFRRLYFRSIYVQKKIKKNMEKTVSIH